MIKRQAYLAAMMVAITFNAALGTAQATEAPKAVVANNGAPVNVYYPLAGELLRDGEAEDSFLEIARIFRGFYGDQVPAAIAELKKLLKPGKEAEADDTIVSVADLFPNAAKALEKRGKSFNGYQLYLVIGSEGKLKELGCYRTNQNDLEQALAAAKSAKAEESNAQKAADDLQKQVDAAKANPQFAKVTDLKTGIAQLKKDIATPKPKNVPQKQYNTAKKNNQDSLTAKKAELKAEEPKLEPIAKEIADLETKLEAAKAELKTKSDAAAKATAEYDTKTKNIIWACKDNADQALLSLVEKFLGSNSVSKAEFAAADPFIQTAKVATNPRIRVLNTWAAISRLRPASIAFLTMPSNLNIRGLVTEVTDAKNIPQGEPFIGLNPDTGASVTTTAKPGDRIFAFEPSLIDSIVRRFGGGGGTGLRLEFSGLWAASFSNPNTQADNGLGGVSVGISRKFALSQRFAIAPTASVGWVYVTGESNRRNSDTTASGRSATLITGGARAYVNISRIWRPYVVGEFVILPGRGVSTGVGIETSLIPRVLTAFDVRYLQIADTGVSSGSRWNKNTGDVGIKGLILSVRASF